MPGNVDAPLLAPDDAELLRWLEAALGTARVVDVLKSWALSCVFRVESPGGTAVFKAIPPELAREADVLLHLAGFVPEHAPTILASDRARGWVLMRDPGEGTLAGQPLPRWEAAVAAYARLQVACLGECPALQALGVPLLDGAALLERYRRMCAEGIASLEPDERRRFATQDDRVCELIGALEHSPVPLALEHGDYWSENVLCHGNRYRVIDWDAASIAPAFFSLPPLLIARTPDERRRLRDAYLGPWRPLGSSSELARWYELAQPLAALHHAAGYHFAPAILPSELDVHAGAYARFFLQLLGEPPDRGGLS